MKRFRKSSLVLALGASILCATPMIQSVYAAEAITTVIVEKAFSDEDLRPTVTEMYENKEEYVIEKHFSFEEDADISSILTGSFEVDGRTYVFDSLEEEQQKDKDVYIAKFVSEKHILEQFVDLSFHEKVFWIVGIASAAFIVTLALRKVVDTIVEKDKCSEKKNDIINERS